MRSGSPARRRLTPALLVMAMVAALLPLGQAATAATNTRPAVQRHDAVHPNGDDHELRRLCSSRTSRSRRGSGGPATGVGINTGPAPADLDTRFPLIAKGRAESDENRRHADINYFLGIDAATNTLAADFEEARTHRQTPQR